MVQTSESQPIPFKSSTNLFGNALFFAPHPDDEIFGCGGAIMRHLQQGDKIKVVIVTDGGLPVHESQNVPDYPEIRKKESLAAAKILGYGQPEFLGFKDGFLKADDELIVRLIDIIRQFQPQNVYLPDHTEIHPDHLALNKAGIEAARKFPQNVNLFFYEIGQPLRPNFFLDITDIQPVLDSAIDCFTSQQAVQDYKTQIRSLHAYRSYTLGDKIKFAEAYRLMKSDELKTGETLWQEKRLNEIPNLPETITDEDFPLISVIVRTMNRPQLPEALESIASQTYPNLEVIVVDAQGEKPLDLGERCGRFPLQVVSKRKPLNRPAAANAGLDKVKGDYFCFLDEDDIILPKHIENLYAVLNFTKAPAAYDIIEKIDTNNTSISFNSSFDYLKLIWGNYIPNMAVLYRSDILCKGANFDVSFEIYEDWDFLLQVAALGEFIFHQEKGGIYRDTNSSGVFQNPEQIKNGRKNIYHKWIPTLNAQQLSDLLMSFDYFEISESGQVNQLKARIKFLTSNINDLEVLATKLKTDHDKFLALSEDTALMKKQLEVVSKQYSEKVYELEQLSVWKLIIQKMKIGKPSSIAMKFSQFRNSLIPDRIIQKIRSRNNHSKNIGLIKDSGLFDETYYRQNNPDVNASGINPAFHYLLFGGFEGRKPCDKFDSAFYLEQYPDVKESKMNPLLHYLLYGKTENRRISSIVSVEVLKERWKAKKYNQYDELSHAEILKFRGSISILFIGHDAGIGGGQMLLLSLVKWFYKNTGIDFKILLLTGGELVESYHAIAPTLVWDECKKYSPTKENFSATIREFVGKIDLVYGNTMVSSFIYDELSYLNVPVITHVHELENTIRLYESTAAIKNMRHFTALFMVASNQVAENLIKNHGIAPGKIEMVPDFIEIRDLNFNSSKNELRKKLGLPQDGMLVFGAGSITWRKGVDLFIETAIVLKQKGMTDFHFIWIGDNYWEVDRSIHNICTWDELEQKIVVQQVKNHITFLSTRENFYEYFLSGDIFFLSSREDPFPLVCLEAAQCSIPIICFENSGGMPDFVANDAGFVVPFEDVNVAAEKMVFLKTHLHHRIGLGAKAREKFLSGYTMDISAPKILTKCLRVGNFHPVVSVIVPNYNYAPFLDERLSSIYNQTFKEFEVIILDDASTDDSLAIIEKYRSKPNTSVVLNKVNSGSPFRQWQKGITAAKGEIIWIAESDDFSAPDFLALMLPFFNHPEVALAHCNSNIIDENDNITGDYTDYHRKLDFNHWKYNYRVKSTQEINFGLGVKNSILNVSSVIFRKEAIPPDIFIKLEAFKFSGDWLFYIELLKGRQIAYCHEKLNFHRRHRQTLTTQFNSDEQKKLTLLQEAAKIHARVLDLYELNPQFAEKWKFHIHEQIGAFYPTMKEDEFNKYYPYDVINNKIKELTAKAEAKQKRWVFLTTNDGASMGGSEKLWIQAALETKERGDEVIVVIKKWEPEPDFIDDLRKAGILVLFKNYFEFSQIVEFNPSLMIISIGDQDEGTEWYEQCSASKIPYVIVNQLTKEPMYWPVNEQLVPKLIKGQEGAEIVLFTGKNNLRVMEKRLGHPITNSGIFYNPTGTERNINIPYPKSGEKLQIAIVGNLHNIHKGQQLAIELFAKQKWRVRPVHLNIYGKGQDEDELKRQVYDRYLTNVTFCGFANDLTEVWAQNHAIFLPSYMEGLPIVLMSAMLCARVSIATDIGSHTEVISDNVSGFIAAKPGVEALDEALERAWQRREEWEKMGLEARSAILKFLPEDPLRFFIHRIELFSMVQS